MYSLLYGPLRTAFWPGGREIARYRRELERAQWLPGDALQAVQFQKLKRLLAHACENVPYYRERFQREDIHPEDVKSWDAFRALPTLSRQDIIDHLEALVAPAYRDALRLRTSSGSTGTPMSFYLNRATSRWSGALQGRCRGWYGVRPGDKVAWFWSAQRDMPDRSWTWRDHLTARVKRRRYLNVFDMTEARMRAFAAMLTRWQPHMFRSNPAVLALFTRFAQAEGFTRIRPRLIESTAQKLTDPQRRLFEDFYQCPVADNYSNIELHDIAYQCPAGGLHVVETRVLEIVGDDGRPVPPGQVGEIVVTGLHELGMPFIRYRTGDLGITGQEACPCGRGMPVLREIVGRQRDFTLTADGGYVYGAFFAELFEHAPEVIRYQVYQPDRQHLEVRLQCQASPSPDWLANVQARLQTHFGQAVHIALLTVDDLPLPPSGKHRFVVSAVEPDLVRD
jgi:phenylacetate-CoA ligase